MAPSLPGTDHRNQRLGHPVFLCDLSLVGGRFFDFTNFGLVQSVAAVLFAAYSWLPIFGHHIGDIGCVIPEEQMAWIYAGSDIASMENKDAMMASQSNDSAVFKLPRKPMGKNEFTIEPELSIPRPYCRSCPDPASIGTILVDLAPEAIERARIEFSHDDSFQSLRSGSRFGARTPPRSEVITALVRRRAA